MTETNTIFNDKVHDEERNENDARTNTDDDDITRGYNDYEDITNDYRREREGVGTETDRDSHDEYD